MHKTFILHVAFGCVTAALASRATYVALTGVPDPAPPSQAHAQTLPPSWFRKTELFKTTMNDVLGRVVTIRRTERDPGNGSGAHRHPGSHTFGYVLEGAYEVKIDDGPLQKLGPGDTFYEPPGALHAVSRNASSVQPARYLVIHISDPTNPQTVPQ